MNDDEFDKVLAQRHRPQAPEGLAQRIIVRAKAAGSVLSWAEELKGMFLIVQPSYALAACLALGVIVGIEAELFLALLEEDWGSFLYVEESIDEDWL